MISVVIVTFNAQDWIAPCIRSALMQSSLLEVVVVDNHSTDRTCELVRSTFPEVVLVELPDNVGFGRANNVGIKIALEHGADGVFLLNQDATLESETLQTLLDVSERHPEYGILSPVHLDSSGQRFHRGFANYVGRPTSDFLHQLYFGVPAEICTVPFVPAALWYLPRRTLETVGGFDPLFFMYAEDGDLCERVKRAGLKVGFVPAARARHDDTEQSFSTWKKRQQRLSHTLSALKYSASTLPKAILREVRHGVAEAIQHLLYCRFSDAWINVTARCAALMQIRAVRLSRATLSDPAPYQHLPDVDDIGAVPPAHDLIANP